MHAQAISQAEQLIAVNPASPYADRLLQLAAESEIARGKLDRAKATLESLLKDYPGSPLVPEVKKLLGQLASGEVPKPKPRAILRRRP